MTDDIIQDLYRILQGDSAVRLKELPDNYVDCVVTDPPYGMAFMGKEWDKALPPLTVWKEVFRVMKHGSFAFIMSIPRQDLLARMIIDLENVGFVVNFTSLYWVYANGFPKATNAAKLADRKQGIEPTRVKINPSNRKSKIVNGGGFDKFIEIENGNIKFNKPRSAFPNDHKANKESEGWQPLKDEYYITEPTSDLAKELDGAYLGFQPKPAVEVILVVMKPLSEGSYIAQAMKKIEEEKFHLKEIEKIIKKQYNEVVEWE